MCRQQEQKGQAGQAHGHSRGGFATKIHGKADGCGDLIAFDLTGGEASDCTHFETLLDIGPDISPLGLANRCASLLCRTERLD